MEELKIELVPVDELEEYELNAKLHPEEQVGQIIKSIQQFGFNDPIAVDENNVIIEGHGRLLAVKRLGIEEVPIIRLGHLDEEQKKAYILAHNKLTMNTDFDLSVLERELNAIEDIDMSDFGFDMEALDDEMSGENKYKENSVMGSVGDRFVIAPFSILNARSGQWQNRKKLWISLGIDSSDGRDEALLGEGLNQLAKASCSNLTGTSIFDPVLCEIMYKWYNLKGGKIYDCFSGGSVRGVVASKLGYQYQGIDLRQEQIDANIKQAEKLNEKKCDMVL